MAILVGVVLAALSASWVAASKLSAPALAKVGTPPGDVPFEEARFGEVSGWFLQGKNENSCVLLMHGVRSNRWEMVSRAKFLYSRGYSSLAIDLQAHGESIGEEITFGYRESESARKALRYLREEKGCKVVVAIGSSLGGAAALLGPEPLKVEGYVLEAVYPGVETAVNNRLKMRFGAIGALFAPLLYEQIPFRLNIALEQLQPAEAIKRINTPVMIFNGTEDEPTTPEDATLIYKNAPTRKSLVWFEGAKHTNLFEYDFEKYSSALLGFLATLM